MADYKKLVPIIRRWEGGYVNDPLDRGGATNCGVTLATWKSYCAKKGKVASVDSLKAMSEDEWGEIFKEMYWDRFRADEINDQSIANILVDWLWGSGVHAIRHAQRLVNVADDGIVGRKTLDAINAENPSLLFSRIKRDRIDFINGIVRRNPSQNRFINGWTNRINSFSHE